MEQIIKAGFWTDFGDFETAQSHRLTHQSLRERFATKILNSARFNLPIRGNILNFNQKAAAKQMTAGSRWAEAVPALRGPLTSQRTWNQLTNDSVFLWGFHPCWNTVTFQENRITGGVWAGLGVWHTASNQLIAIITWGSFRWSPLSENERRPNNQSPERTRHVSSLTRLSEDTSLNSCRSFPKMDLCVFLNGWIVPWKFKAHEEEPWEAK